MWDGPCAFSGKIMHFAWVDLMGFASGWGTVLVLLGQYWSSTVHFDDLSLWPLGLQNKSMHIVSQERCWARVFWEDFLPAALELIPCEICCLWTVSSARNVLSVEGQHPQCLWSYCAGSNDITSMDFIRSGSLSCLCLGTGATQFFLPV